MVVFPNCKINLGLHVTSKRGDGFHNIETVFYPVDWCDALEVIENKKNEPFSLSMSGLAVDGDLKDNLLYKTWNIISGIRQLPPIVVHLHKHIPMGAGIGGGSSDAAFLIQLLDQKFGLGLSETQKHDITSQLGSDCSFFLTNKPLHAHGRGNEFSTAKIDLGKYYLLLVYPDIHSNTKDAFAGLQPKQPEQDLKAIVEKIPVSEWKQHLFNDFEATIFKKYPAIQELKDNLYQSGALYSSLSGSGSTVYGIFEKKPVPILNPSYTWHLQLPTF